MYRRLYNTVSTSCGREPLCAALWTSESPIEDKVCTLQTDATYLQSTNCYTCVDLKISTCVLYFEKKMLFDISKHYYQVL